MQPNLTKPDTERTLVLAKKTMEAGQLPYLVPWPRQWPSDGVGRGSIRRGGGRVIRTLCWCWNTAVQGFSMVPTTSHSSTRMVPTPASTASSTALEDVPSATTRGTAGAPTRSGTGGPARRQRSSVSNNRLGPWRWPHRDADGVCRSGTAATRRLRWWNGYGTALMLSMLLGGNVCWPPTCPPPSPPAFVHLRRTHPTHPNRFVRMMPRRMVRRRRRRRRQRRL
jgi:hypothetical protein